MRKARATCAALLGVLVAGCADTGTPSGLSDASAGEAVAYASHTSAPAEKGFLKGWLNGKEVRLHYTRPYFCAAPPESGADSGCVFGIGPEVAPRPGFIPIVYGIAPVGFQPDPATLACLAGAPCINHPATIDVSRLIPGATNVAPLAHSHIIEDRTAGWHLAVNIRVFDPRVWNEIAAAKSLAKVRKLQADPAVGGAGLISQDTPTNAYFFFSVHASKRERR